MIKEIISILSAILFTILVLVGSTRLVGNCSNHDQDRYEKGYHTLVYKVYYPGNTKTYTRSNVYEYYIYSSKGTNTLSAAIDVQSTEDDFYVFMFGDYKTSRYTLYTGTAPVEVVSFTKNN